MVSGRPFIYKKQYKIYFLFGIIVHASACSIPIREYEFPEQSFLEQRRMCQQVSSRKSKQYMVVDRKVLPMKKDEIILVCLSGRGDKDVNEVADRMGVSL